MAKKGSPELKSVNFEAQKVRKLFTEATSNFIQQREKFEHSHKVLYSFIAGIGLIVFWYGIWEGLKLVPVLGHPVVAIILGGGVLLLCGAYAYQLIGGQASMLMGELQDVSEDIDRVVEAVEDIDEFTEEVADKVEDLSEFEDEYKKCQLTLADKQ